MRQEVRERAETHLRLLAEAALRARSTGADSETGAGTGALALTAHPDADAVVVLAALGGIRPRCVPISQASGRGRRLRASPSPLDVVATGEGPGGLPCWEIAGDARR